MAMLNNQRVSICAMVKTWHTSTPIWITGINRTGDAAVCQNAQHKSPRFKNMAVIIYLRHLSIHPSIIYIYIYILYYNLYHTYDLIFFTVVARKFPCQKAPIRSIFRRSSHAGSGSIPIPCNSSWRGEG